MAPFLVQVTLWEKNEQPASRTDPETARVPSDAAREPLVAAAVDRRVMVETPDPKADFAVNLPRTGALRNRGKPANPTATGETPGAMGETPGKICYEQGLNPEKDIEMRETAADTGCGDLPALLSGE